MLTPHLDALADDGVVFERAYCNSPLCAPSRASMMTGQLPSAIGAYDNASDFATSVPTFAHHLRREGYRTALIGRMHFIGPDQLHGFDERLTSDVYPAGFDMVPDWELPENERLSWYHNADSVLRAGVATATVQRDFDEEVTFRSLRYLTDRARQPRQRAVPAGRLVHPSARPVRAAGRALAPLRRRRHRRAPGPGRCRPSELDPHSRRLLSHVRARPLSARTGAGRPGPPGVLRVGQLRRRSGRRDPAPARRARAAREDTVVLVTSDHGELLGERGLWYKMSPFEGSIRVPMIVHAPGRLSPAPGRRRRSRWSICCRPWSRSPAASRRPRRDGVSFWPLAQGATPAAAPGNVIEYLAEGVHAPQLTLIQDRYKYVVCPGDPDQLFDLDADPDELHQSGRRPATGTSPGSGCATNCSPVGSGPARAEVLASQRRRQFIAGAFAGHDRSLGPRAGRTVGPALRPRRLLVGPGTRSADPARHRPDRPRGVGIGRPDPEPRLDLRDRRPADRRSCRRRRRDRCR